MPYFVIYAEDKPGTLEHRMAARPAHLDRLKQLEIEARLLVAGPCPLTDDPAASAGFSGSVVIASFDSTERAQQWANADPYITAGVYEKVTVKPYKPVLGSAVKN